MKAIHDPANVIVRLQDLIPVYPVECSRYRVQQALQDAHCSPYQMEWLAKATQRGDTFSQHLQELPRFFNHLYIDLVS